MKILHCVHGFPPEQQGGTERSSAALARGLAREGHDLLVVAGSFEGAVPGEVAIGREALECGAGKHFRLERWTRPDLYFDHWHKSRSARVAAAFRALLRRERPDVVHVFHWLRLTRDLVAIAAQEGIPSVVSLGDSFITCPLTFRVRPESGEVCERPLSAAHCLSCAAQVAPRTPWVSMEAGFMELGARTRDLHMELQLARARLVPSASFGQRLIDGLGAQAEPFEFEVQAPAGVPANLARAASRTPRESGALLSIGAWGQQSLLKGTDLLFEALGSLADPARVELQLAGPEERPGFVADLQNRYPKLRCSWQPAFDASDLAAHPVSAVDLMLSASRAPESFGIVLEEARALGLPALLPRAGAFAERAGEESGALLFTPGDANSLREQVERLLADGEQLAVLGERVPAPISQTEVLAAHLEIYARVLQEGAPAAPAAPEWYAERMATFAEEQWDSALGACSTDALGFVPEENVN